MVAEGPLGAGRARRSSATRSAGLGTILIALAASIGVLLTIVPATAQISPGGDETPVANEPPVTRFDTVPPKPETFDRVYDEANVLDIDQYKRFHFDIGRLWNHDLPTMIYIRESFQDEVQSQAFADEMRDVWDIESAPGADDGLVLVATIRPRFPHTAILTASYGANAFPTGQLTEQGFQEVLTEEATPRMRVGNVNGGLTYALRRVIYDTEYGAPFPEPRTSMQRAAGWGFVAWNIAVAATLVLLVFAPGRVPLPSRLRRRWWQLGAAAALTMIGLAGAVYSRSNLATATGALAALLLALLAIQLGRRAREAGRARHIRRATRNSPRQRPARSVRHA
jgi:uncharacterized membrane protein YgcG